MAGMMTERRRNPKVPGRDRQRTSANLENMSADFVSRAGQKLDHALAHFGLDISGLTCADLGSNTGGFVDVLLRRGAAKVYAIDTGYGVLDWKLRKDPRVVVMERTNAMHVALPEKVQVVTIDVAWTKQKHILPSARAMLADDGICVSLIKPHYEAAAAQLKKGVLPAELVGEVVDAVKRDIAAAGFDVVGVVESPIKGAKGNVEVLVLLRPRE
jgi:23S rRNA (cytidine1920-2'-O)/16S rRNA (cytidine1409-2'-O)-methyltransferase